MRLILVFSLVFSSLALGDSVAPPPPSDQVQMEIKNLRQELAAEVFIFLRDHAAHAEDPPTDWVYSGAYELHLTAKKLYNVKIPLKDIKVPTSDWKKGGYKEYYNPLVFLKHEYILAKIIILLKWGVTNTQ